MIRSMFGIYFILGMVVMMNMLLVMCITYVVGIISWIS